MALDGLQELDITRAAMRRSMMEAYGGNLPPELDEGSEWQLLGAGGDAALAGIQRQQTNDQARYYYLRDPQARHIVELCTAYTFGRGVTLSASDSEANAHLQKFWQSVRNRASISRVREQWRMSRDIQLDGEVFLMFFTSTLTGNVTVRRIPAREITKIYYADGDAAMPVGYRREYVDRTGKNQIQKIFDYRVADLKNEGLRLLGMDAPNTEICMMHILGNDFDGRGLTELATIIPWIKALKGFLEDRATYTMAMATFAFRMNVQGNRQAVERLRDQFADYENQWLGQYTDGKERRQAANTFIGNKAVELEQFKTDSGASNAYQDARMFKQQVGIGKGIFEHYLGDPSTGNLATATAMELPMLKLFEFGQSDWGEVFEEIADFVLRQGVRFNQLRTLGEADVDTSGSVPLWDFVPRDEGFKVDAIFPPIVAKDLSIWAGALGQIGQVETMSGHRVLPMEEKARIALKMFGYTGNVNQMISKLESENYGKGEIPGTEPAGETPDPPSNSPREQGENNAADDAADNADGQEVAAEVTGVNISSGESELVEGYETIKQLLNITKEDIEQARKDFAAMPTLEEFAKQLGFDSVEDLDDA